MAECRHGTDISEYDCCNCESEDDAVSEAAQKIHELCLNCDGGEVPEAANIKPILRALVDDLLEFA